MFDPIITALVLVAVGLGAGVLGAMLGVGGGIVMVPSLTFLGLTPAQAAGTSLIAVASTSVSSAIEYSRQKRINYRLGLEMGALAIPGAVLGAILSESLSAESFPLYFGMILILTGIYVLYKNSILKDGSAKKRSVPLQAGAFAAAFGAGMISSMFGVGGGIIFVPAMLLVLGLTMHRAAPTSQLTLMMASIAGVIVHAALLNPDYLQAIALSVGAFVGAQIGARISRSAKELLLQKLLGSTLITVGIVLIAMAFKLIRNWYTANS